MTLASHRDKPLEEGNHWKGEMTDNNTGKSDQILKLSLRKKKYDNLQEKIVSF